MQMTLFGEVKLSCKKPITSERKYIGWPCDIAQELPIGEERLDHIAHCKECTKLLDELEKSIGLRMEIK